MILELCGSHYNGICHVIGQSDFAYVLFRRLSSASLVIGWLEPMLDRIAENRSNVVAPIIDVLDDETLKYQYSSAYSTSVGGFDWNLQFNWHPVPDREKKRRKSMVDPVW